MGQIKHYKWNRHFDSIFWREWSNYEETLAVHWTLIALPHIEVFCDLYLNSRLVLNNRRSTFWGFFLFWHFPRHWNYFSYAPFRPFLTCEQRLLNCWTRQWPLYDIDCMSLLYPALSINDNEQFCLSLFTCSFIRERGTAHWGTGWWRYRRNKRTFSPHQSSWNTFKNSLIIRTHFRVSKSLITNWGQLLNLSCTHLFALKSLTLKTLRSPSFWKRGLVQLGNGQLIICINVKCLVELLIAHGLNYICMSTELNDILSKWCNSLLVEGQCCSSY